MKAIIQKKEETDFHLAAHLACPMTADDSLANGSRRVDAKGAVTAVLPCTHGTKHGHERNHCTRTQLIFTTISAHALYTHTHGRTSARARTHTHKYRLTRTTHTHTLAHAYTADPHFCPWPLPRLRQCTVSRLNWASVSETEGDCAGQQTTHRVRNCFAAVCYDRKRKKLEPLAFFSARCYRTPGSKLFLYTKHGTQLKKKYFRRWLLPVTTNGAKKKRPSPLCAR